MRAGKLTNIQLEKIVLDRLGACSKDVLEGPGTGLDCGVIKTKGDLLVISSDPITGASENIGRIAIHVSCNDIACCGIKPAGINLVMIIPETSTEDDILKIIDQVSDGASRLGIDIVGGHTEVSPAVNKTILMTTAFGYAENGKVIYSSGAHTGDSILMTKRAALEGTSILAHDHADKLTGVLDTNELEEARGLIDQISVVPEGVICGRSGLVSALHDATEGGIVGAVSEMAKASGKGCLLDLRKIPVHPVTSKICDHLKIDPFRLISSGTMIIATKYPEEIKRLLAEKDIESAVIGEFTDESTLIIDMYGEIGELEFSGQDELYKIE